MAEFEPQFPATEAAVRALAERYLQKEGWKDERAHAAGQRIMAGDLSIEPLKVI